MDSKEKQFWLVSCVAPVIILLHWLIWGNTLREVALTILMNYFCFALMYGIQKGKEKIKQKEALQHGN